MIGDGALAEIAACVRGCRRCPTLAAARRIPGAGPAGAAVMFVAEAPGRLGAGRTGVPLLGDRSGDLFRAMLAESGLAAEDVYVTNAVKCAPADAAGRNRRPSAREIAACRGHLQAEWAAVGPRLVVPLGAVACQVVTGRPLAEAVGRLLPAWCGPAFVLHHPAYVVRGALSTTAYRAQWLALQRALGTVAAAPPRAD